MAKRRFGSKPTTQVNALASLRLMLAGARSIEHFTVGQIMSMYRVDRQTAEYELTMAQQRRSEREQVPG